MIESLDQWAARKYPIKDKSARDDGSDEDQNQQSDQPEYKNVIASFAFAFSGGAFADELHILLVCFPDKIERISEDWNRADKIIHADIERHSEQCDLWHSVTNARKEDVE